MSKNEKKKYKIYQHDKQNAQFLSQELKSDILVGHDLFVGLGNFDFFNDKKDFLKQLQTNKNSREYDK